MDHEPAVLQLLLVHSKLESIVRYLGLEVNDPSEFQSRQKSDFVDSSGMSQFRGVADLKGSYV